MNRLTASLRRGAATLVERPLYLMMMVVVPLAVAFFFLDLMEEGLPLKAPVGVVDLDHSSLSRQTIRKLGASELLDVRYEEESFHDALDKVRRGESFGFFHIPDNFEQETVAGRSPTLSFYSNLTYFVPGSLAYKAFKTTAVTVTAGVVVTQMVSVGLDENSVGSMIQPVVIQEHTIGNPWMNYSIYLCNSFIPGVVCLLVMMVTVFTIMQEVKTGRSVEWLATGGNSMVTALAGKLLPQTLIFTIVGWGCLAMINLWGCLPLNCPAWHLLLAMFLLVVASQGFGSLIAEIMPNFRLALSGVALIGILSFSIAAFSFPVASMYGSIAIFSYILPVRWYFLVYCDQALNGIPLFFSRWYYIVMIGFGLLPLLGLRRLRRLCLNPVYLS